MSVREALVDEAVDSIKEMIDEALAVITETDGLTDAERREVYFGIRGFCSVRRDMIRKGEA